MSHRQIMEALSGLLLGMFVAILSSTIVTNALPHIVTSLHGSQSAYTWVVTASLLAMTVTTPLWGKLADLTSKKLLVQIALIIYVLGSAAAGLSQNTSTLIGFRIVQGVGVGGLSALAQIVMAAMISPRERGRYSGYLGATFAVATVGGPLIGGVITDTSWLGWRWCFYVGVPFAIIALIVLQKTLHLPTVKRDVKVDWTGAFFLAAAVSLLMVWVTFAGINYNWISWQTWTMVGGAVLLGLIFVLIESKVNEPLVPLRLFRNKTITLTSIASLFVGVGMFSGTVFLSQYFQLARDKSPTMSGVMTIPLIGGLFISSTVSGQIITRTGRWKAFLVSGSVLLTAGLGLLGTIRYDTVYWHTAIFMALVGLGIGMMMQNLVLAAQNQVQAHELGAASSLVTFFRSLGGAVGVSALGAVLSNRITHYMKDGMAGLGVTSTGSSDSVPDLSTLTAPVRKVVEGAYGHGVADVFLYAAPLALIAFFIVLFIKEVALRSSSGLEQAATAAATADAPAVGQQPAPAPEPELVSVGATPVADRLAETVLQPVAAYASVGGGTPTLPGGTEIRGQVRNSDGTGVAHATLTLISLTGRQLGRATTRSGGGYSLEAPGSGSYVLIAAADGHQPQAATVVVGDEPVPYDVVLSGTNGLAGVVVSAADTLPIGDAMVVVTDIRGEVITTGKTADSGAFSFEELPPGDFTLAVNAAGFRPTALPVEVAGTGTTRIEIALRAGAQLQGTIRAGADRRPLADARVTLVDAAGNVVGTATTGSDGAYAFTDLDAGEYSLVASGYPPAATALTVGGHGTNGFDMELNHPEG
jgi:EmrB/QacA subfamily drug resistance transporter